jgi:hypothetical protein
MHPVEGTGGLNRSPRVWSRIDLSQEFEVRYWAGKLGVNERELRDVVGTVGPIVEKVRQHLAGRSGGDSDG